MAHKSRLGGLIIDCEGDLEPAATFWAEALGGAVMMEEGDRYAGIMMTSGFWIEVQQVNARPGVHLDIATDDVVAEEARLVALGARRVEAIEDWVVMEAPTGHRFCIVPASGGLHGAATWGGA